jgi:hypothetical protein
MGLIYNILDRTISSNYISHHTHNRTHTFPPSPYTHTDDPSLLIFQNSNNVTDDGKCGFLLRLSDPTEKSRLHPTIMILFHIWWKIARKTLRGGDFRGRSKTLGQTCGTNSGSFFHSSSASGYVCSDVSNNSNNNDINNNNNNNDNTGMISDIHINRNNDNNIEHNNNIHSSLINNAYDNYSDSESSSEENKDDNNSNNKNSGNNNNNDNKNESEKEHTTGPLNVRLLFKPFKRENTGKDRDKNTGRFLDLAPSTRLYYTGKVRKHRN